MKISVIVPVYNVAPYLAICLNSLLPALAPGDELLLVQGASTDKSKEISLHYKAEYTQVMVLEQNGTGLSNARNCGLQPQETMFYLLTVTILLKQVHYLNYCPLSAKMEFQWTCG